jgi:MFS family permease
MTDSRSARGFLGLSGYHWFVLLAAWLGWGFDVFDGLLFNFVARTCIPTLLHIDQSRWGDKDVKSLVTLWQGILSSALLLGWAAGGILFGKITDKLGRSRTMLLTMLTYALATAACAGAQNIWMLLAFRFLSALGIGGEWAAGASLVAEALPEEKRVTGGALLYTSAPVFLFIAGFVNKAITSADMFKNDPTTAWRYVFLSGLVAAAVAFVIRRRLREPEGFQGTTEAPKIRELFTPEMRRHTIGGLAMALVALISWWSVSNFIQLVATFLADDVKPKLEGAAAIARRGEFLWAANNWFNLGGVIGTLITIPFALHLGRRKMFAIYFVASALAIFTSFGLPMDPHLRVKLYFFVGLTVFGVFGSFTFYLPELFPRRLRGTGAGFCYNTGRVITAAFPFAIGAIGARPGVNPLDIIKWIALAPVVGLIFLAVGLAEETRGRPLA